MDTSMRRQCVRRLDDSSTTTFASLLLGDFWRSCLPKREFPFRDWFNQLKAEVQIAKGHGYILKSRSIWGSGYLLGSPSSYQNGSSIGCHRALLKRPACPTIYVDT